MAKYKVEVLRGAMDSLDGTYVTTGSDRMSPSAVVGRVIDHEYDDGIIATVEIEDDATTERIESGLAVGSTERME